MPSYINVNNFVSCVQTLCLSCYLNLIACYNEHRYKLIAQNVLLVMYLDASETFAEIFQFIIGETIHSKR